MSEASIPLPSLPLGQEEQHSVVLEEVRFSLVLGISACPVITKRGLGPTLASCRSTKGHRSGAGRLTLLRDEETTACLFQGQEVTLSVTAEDR